MQGMDHGTISNSILCDELSPINSHRIVLIWTDVKIRMFSFTKMLCKSFLVRSLSGPGLNINTVFSSMEFPSSNRCNGNHYTGNFYIETAVVLYIPVVVRFLRLSRVDRRYAARRRDSTWTVGYPDVSMTQLSGI